MKRANLFKRWKIALVIVITKLLTFHGAFASMGSTGGGGRFIKRWWKLIKQQYYKQWK